MTCRVISGGQTGCDLAALHAAREAGIETGGWIPRGFLTEDGPRPELAEYGLREMPTADYPSRTRRNVEDCDGVMILYRCSADYLGGGTRLTADIASKLHKQMFVILVDSDPFIYGKALRRREIQTLMVAGSRESKHPGIYEAARAFLADVFRAWKEQSP
jgi:predicted Rossmann-fold nucleotide-binding protein